MTEPSFFDFNSEPGDFDQPNPTPWARRFRDLKHSFRDDVMEATFDIDQLPTHTEIIEMIEALHAGESSPFLQSPSSDRRCSTYLPDYYEARYAYPLIVWFHTNGSSDLEITSVMPGISERNF